MNDELLVISLTDHVGGAEQCLSLIAAQTGCKMLFLLKAKSNRLQGIDPQKAGYLSNVHLLIGFIKLPFVLYPYRRYTLITSHSYLSAVIGIMRRLGYLKGVLIARESTSIFIRYKGWRKQLYKLLYKMGYPALSRIVCQSDVMADQLISQAPYLNKKNIKVIANPLDFTSAKKRADLIVSPIAGHYICAAGRLISIKGFDILIRAFAQLSESHTEVKLIILGSGPQHHLLTQLIADLKLEKNVMLVGHMENPYPYFKSAQMCVVPSILEGFPNVLLQMMAVNNLIISTLCAGGIADIPDIVKVEPGDIKSLHKGMEKALFMKKPERAKIDAYLEERNPQHFIHKLFSDLEVDSSALFSQQ